jgi:hypothetical protein
MKIEIADTSALPEHLRPLAATADGKTVIDLAALAPMAEVETFKGKALTAQQEAIDRRKALDAWKKLGETPEAVQAKLAAGADPEIVKQLQAKLAETETGYKAKFSALLRNQAMAELKAELSKAGVVPEGLDVLAAFAAPRIVFDDDGGMRVMSPDGQTPMIGKGQNGGATMADLAASLAGAIPHLVADGGKGGSGKPPGSSGGTPGTKTMKRAEFTALSPAEQAARIKDGFAVID